MTTYRKSTTICRFIAVILTLLSLTSLFWPAMLNYSREYLADVKEDREDYYYYHYDHITKADAKALANAEIAPVYITGAYSFFSYRNFLSFYFMGQSMEDKYMKKDWDSKSLSSHYKTYQDYLNSLSKEKKLERTTTIAGAIVGNVLFFGLLACGILAIILYSLNRTRAFGIIFAVLTLLADIFFIVVLIYMKHIKAPITAPGIGMFLMPLLAIAACIVYRRDRGPVLSDAPTEQTVQPPHPFNPPSPPLAEMQQQNDEAAMWVCPVCGNSNPVSYGFCANCGTQKP